MTSMTGLVTYADPKSTPHLEASPQISIQVLRNLIAQMRKAGVSSLSADDLAKAVDAYRNHHRLA